MVYLPHWPIPDSLGKKQIDYETVFERMSKVLTRLNNPHLKLPPTIHIAGTNGKGSTATFLSQVFKCNNNSFHLYTSPHIHHINERMIINGEMISDKLLYEILEEVRMASNNVDLTFMESITISAFLAFSKFKADVLIMECGMGGRIDATNIINEKIATIITPISFDHEEYLGSDIRRIALEKAMIMRPNTPLFCSAQSNQAKEIIKILADDQKIDHFYYDEDFFIEKNPDDSFDFVFNNLKLNNLPKPNLNGDHQYINIATSLACISKLNNQFNISQDIISNAISTVKYRSRLEKIEYDLIDDCEIWIDGAHNESGAYSLRNWLINQNYLKENYVIVGFTNKKCRPNFLKQFQDIAKLIAVRVEGEPNPEKSERIVEIAINNNIKITDCQNLANAFNFIKRQKKNKSCRIIICGSFYLARDLKKIINTPAKYRELLTNDS